MAERWFISRVGQMPQVRFLPLALYEARMKSLHMAGGDSEAIADDGLLFEA